jgi:hypothetical protein
MLVLGDVGKIMMIVTANDFALLTVHAHSAFTGMFKLQDNVRLSKLP